MSLRSNQQPDAFSKATLPPVDTTCLGSLCCIMVLGENIVAFSLRAASIAPSNTVIANWQVRVQGSWRLWLLSLYRLAKPQHIFSNKVLSPSPRRQQRAIASVVLGVAEASNSYVGPALRFSLKNSGLLEEELFFHEMYVWANLLILFYI